MDIGLWNRLTLDRFTSVGAFLTDTQGNDVLLPNKYLDDSMREGDAVEVFLYKDSLGRLIATTLEPLVQLDQFAYLKVKQLTMHGAFLEWGLEKELIVPFREQAKPMELGKYYLIYLYLDKATQRLVATSKIYSFLHKASETDLQPNQQVELLICDKTDLGVKVIADNRYQGLIFSSDLPKMLRRGAIIDGYVKTVRPDGKLDITLHPGGYTKIDGIASELLNLLKENDGFLPLNDDSSPEEISEATGWSKKAFKQAAGNLYKRKLIAFNENGISLLDE